MDIKKTLNFLLLGSAMSTRNLTSLALVAFFFAVYMLAGGKVSTIPQIKQGESFGSVESTDTFRNAIEDATKNVQPVQPIAAEKEDTKVPSKEIKREETKPQSPKAIEDKKFSLRPTRVPPVEPLASDQTIKDFEQENSQENRIYPEDDLADIERRLKLRR